MNGTTTFEWVGGPQDGQRVVLPGIVDRVLLRRSPPPASALAPSPDDVFLPIEHVEVRLERRRSDLQLIARWPYDMMR